MSETLLLGNQNLVLYIFNFIIETLQYWSTGTRDDVLGTTRYSVMISSINTLLCFHPCLYMSVCQCVCLHVSPMT